MKRMIGLLLVLMLLAATCAIAEEPLVEYRGECPHLYWLVTEDSVAQLEAQGKNEIRAMCIYCETYLELRLPWASGEVQTKRDSELDCEHAYRLESEIIAEGYYPTGKQNSGHEYRYMMAACCEACGDKIDIYNHVGVGNWEVHEFSDTGIHFHLAGTKQHAYMKRCDTCGYTLGTTADCAMFDIGLCTVQLREMGYLQYPPYIIGPHDGTEE